jgi:hypothetical protein
MIFCARATRGLRMMRRSRQTVLLARKAPTIKRWSLDARCERSPHNFLFYFEGGRGGKIVKLGYRLIIVDKAGVLVSEFQLTENALAQPEAFVTVLKQSIEDIEDEEP